MNGPQYSAGSGGYTQTASGVRRSEGELALETWLRRLGITGWEREYQFVPDRNWRFDFAFPAQNLAVEVEGGVWSSGRHTRGQGFIGDLAKYNAAALRGWCVLRFTTDQCLFGDAAIEIQKALEVRVAPALG